MGTPPADGQSSREGTEQDESEPESDDGDFGLFGMSDMSSELAACEDQMSQFMRLNILFSQISTP